MLRIFPPSGSCSVFVITLQESSAYVSGHPARSFIFFSRPTKSNSRDVRGVNVRSLHFMVSLTAHDMLMMAQSAYATMSYKCWDFSWTSDIISSLWEFLCCLFTLTPYDLCLNFLLLCVSSSCPGAFRQPLVTVKHGDSMAIQA